jgi:4-hydroxybenzoate polyprenyltransferase
MKRQRARLAGERGSGSAGVLPHLIGLVWVMHLPRAALYAVAVWLFSAIAASAASRPLDSWTLARVVLGVLCMQATIASVNDYGNRYLDAMNYPGSPIVRALIQPWEAIALSMLLTAIMLALVGSLGPLPLLLACGALVLRLLCVLHLKGSRVSTALCALYTLMTPLLAWSVFGRWQPFLPWLLALGAVAGVGLYVAGSLPELDREIAVGFRGLPHRLGTRRSKLVASATLPILLVLTWALSLVGVVPARGHWFAVATVVALCAALLMAALYLLRSNSGSLRGGFITQVFGLLCLATGWLQAVSR